MIGLSVIYITVIVFLFCFKDALDAMKALGLNPGEQEMIDMTNEVNINGLIYYPDFCKLVLRKYREENREVLNQALFKVWRHRGIYRTFCKTLLNFLSDVSIQKFYNR